MLRRAFGVAVPFLTGAIALACASTDEPTGKLPGADAATSDARSDVERLDAPHDVARRDAAGVDSSEGHREGATGDDSSDAVLRDAAGPELDPTCTSCLEAKCGVQLRACRPDAGCRALVACLAAPTPECKTAFTCGTKATNRAEAIACVSSIAGDGGSFDYFVAVNVCASACSSVCPATPVQDETVSTCKVSFEQNYPALLKRCSATEDCVCNRCAVPLHDCVADVYCRDLLSCKIDTGCSGIECSAICPTWTFTNATFLMEDCLDKQCERCSPADAGP